MSRFHFLAFRLAIMIFWQGGLFATTPPSEAVVACTQPDITPPTILCPATQTLILGPGCHATLPDYITLAAINDDCLPAPTGTQYPAPGTLMSGTGSWNMVLVATDGAGNTSSCSFQLTRVDTAGPRVVCPPTTFEYTTPLACRIPVFWPPPTITDNCGTYSLTCTGQSGDSLSLGFHWISYRIVDGQGRSDTCLFAKIVKAPRLDSTITVAPVIACEGEARTLSTLAGMRSYHWSTGDTGALAVVSHAGWYWVDVTANNQCTARDSFELRTFPLPNPVMHTSGQEICTGPFWSYQWLHDGIPIAGATDSCTTTNLPGQYAVVVTDSNGCQAQGASITILATATPTVDFLEVYPIPAVDFMVVEYQQPLLTPATVALMDLCGRQLGQWEATPGMTRQQLDLQGIPTGTYLLQWSSEGWHHSRKVTILRP